MSGHLFIPQNSPARSPPNSASNDHVPRRRHTNPVILHTHTLAHIDSPETFESLLSPRPHQGPSTPISVGASPPLFKSSSLEFHNISSPFHSEASRITVISDESSRLSADSVGLEQPPTTAAEILDTIEKRLCILAGGVDKKGRLILCIPAQSKEFGYEAEELRRLILYLTDTPPLELKAQGFIAVVDARHSPWTSSKLILHALKDALSSHLLRVYLLQPDQFWKKKQASIGHSKEKTKLPFETILLSSLEKLAKHLDIKQLPPEMGGSLPYDHSEWIKLRLQLEHLIASHSFIMDHFSRLERQITHEDNPRDIQSGETILERQRQLTEQIHKSPQGFLREADDFLERIESQKSKLRPQFMLPPVVEVPYKKHAAVVVRKLIDSMQRRQSQLSVIAEDKTIRLEHCIKIHVFENTSLKLKSWLIAHGEDNLSGPFHIGESSEESSEMLESLKRFKEKLVTISGEVRHLSRVAQLILSSDPVAPSGRSTSLTKLIGIRMGLLHQLMTQLANRIQSREKILNSAVTFNQLFEELRDLCKQRLSHGSSCDRIVELSNQIIERGRNLLQEFRPENLTSQQLQGDNQRTSLPPLHYSPAIEYVTRLLEWTQEQLTRAANNVKKRPPDAEGLRQQQEEIAQAMDWVENVYQTLLDGKMRVWGSPEDLEQLLIDFDNLKANITSTVKYCQNLITRCISYESNQTSQLIAPSSPTLHFRLRYLTQMNTSLDKAMLEYGDRLRLALDLQLARVNINNNLNKYKRVLAAGSSEAAKHKELVTNDLACTTGTATFLRQQLSLPLVPSPPSILPRTEYRLVAETDHAITSLLDDLSSMQAELESYRNTTSSESADKEELLGEVRERRRWVSDTGLPGVLSLSRWGMEQERDQDSFARYLRFEEEHRAVESSVAKLLKSSQWLEGAPHLKEEWSVYKKQFSVIKTLCSCANAFYAAHEQLYNTVTHPGDLSGLEPKKQLRTFFSLRSSVLLHKSECKNNLDKLISLTDDIILLIGQQSFGVEYKPNGMLEYFGKIEETVSVFELEWKFALREIGMEPLECLLRDCNRVLFGLESFVDEFRDSLRVGNSKDDVKQLINELSGCVKKQEEFVEEKCLVVEYSDELLNMPDLFQSHEKSRVELLLSDISRAQEELSSLIKEREVFLKECSLFHSRYSSLMRELEQLEQTLFKPQPCTSSQLKEGPVKIEQIGTSCRREVSQFLKFTSTIPDFPSTETSHLKEMQHVIEARLIECQNQLGEKVTSSKQDNEVDELFKKATSLHNWYLEHMGVYLQGMSALPCTKDTLRKYSQEMTSFQQQTLLSKESEHEALQTRAVLISRSVRTQSDRHRLNQVLQELKNIHKKRTSHFNDLIHLARLSADILDCCEEVSKLISDIDKFCQTADSSSKDVFQEYQARFELSQSCITKLSSLFDQFSSHPAASTSSHESADIQCMKAYDTFLREVTKLKVHFNQVEQEFLSCERSFQTSPPLDQSSHRELELLRDVISQIDGDLVRITRVFPQTLADTRQALDSVTSSQSALSSINRLTLEKTYPTHRLNTLAQSLLDKYNAASDFSLQLSNILDNLFSFYSATDSCKTMLQNLLTQVNANKALPSSLRIERLEKSIAQQQADKSNIAESMRDILSDKQLSLTLVKLDSSIATVQHLFSQLKNAIRLKTGSNGEKLSTDQVDRFELEAFQMIDSIKLKMDDIPELDVIVKRGLAIEVVREQVDDLSVEEDFLKDLVKPVNHLLMTGNSIISTGHPKWLRVERLSEQVSATLKEFKDLVTTNKQRFNLLIELSNSLTEMREWCMNAGQLRDSPLPSENSKELIPLYHKTEACLNSSHAHLSLVENSLWLAQQIKIQHVTEIVLGIKVESESLFELLKAKREDIQARNLLSESSPPPSHSLLPHSETSQGDSSAPNTIITRHTSSTSSQESKSSINTVEQDYALKFIHYIIKDLLASEASYVQHLNRLVQEFIPYFSQTNFTPSSLQGQIPALFANIQELYSLHSAILAALEAKESYPEEVCNAFTSREKEFWAYFLYMKNSFQSQKLIERHDAKVWQEISQKLNIPHPLQFYLLQPLQRIPKYQILLKDLLDYAITSRSPHASALDATLNLLHWIPTCADNALHWSFVTECTQVVNEKDILLQNAFYATFGFKEKNAREYRLFMTSELMIFCEVVHKSHCNDMYLFKEAFKLSECFLTFCYVDVSSKFRISIFPKPELRSYSILAKTPEIKNKWVEGMVKLLADYHGVLLPMRDIPSNTSPPVDIFEVTMNFEPTGSGLYLKLARGQRVRVLKKSQGDVWLVAVVGSICEEGLIPSSYLREIPIHKPSWASSSVFSESVYSQDPSVIFSTCQHIDNSHLYTLLSDYSTEGDDPLAEDVCPFKSGDRVVVLDTESDATLWLVSKCVGPFELEPEKHLPYLLLAKMTRPTSARGRGQTHNSEFSLSPSQDRVKGRTIDSITSENENLASPLEPCKTPVLYIDTEQKDNTEQEVTDQQWEKLKEQASYLHLATSPTYSVSGFPQARGSRANSSPQEHQSDTMMVNVVKDFEADESDLLTVHTGSRIEVLYTEGTGWVMCRSLMGEEGLVPDSCLELSSLEDTFSPVVSHKSSFSQPVVLSHQYVKSYDSQDSSVPSDFPVLSQVKTFHTSPETAESGEYSAALNAPNLTALEKGALVIDELVCTEQEYVQDLAYSISHYPEAFSRKEIPKQLQTICTELFELVSRLHSFHRNIFLPVLRMCQSHPENLGECFTSQRESLKLYIDYIEQKHVLEGPMREFSSQIEDVERNIPKRAKQTLADYLIRPVHRITKYPLILQDMLKYSIRAEKHLPKIEAAIELCKEILRQANTRIHFLMLEFEHKQILEDPCILSDSFLVQVGNRHALKERQLFIFPKLLLFSKKKQFPGGKENYYLKDFLQCADISDVKACPDHPNTIELTSGERILLKSKCADSHKLWLDALSSHINATPLEGSTLQHLTMTCRKGLFRMDSIARRRAFSLSDPPRVRNEPPENKYPKTQAPPAIQHRHKPTTSLLAPRIVQLPSEHEFWIQKPLTVTCRFASNPPPSEVRWTHGDTPVISKSQDTVFIVTSHVSSKLRIDKCEFSHSGSYTCYVTNEVGETSKSTQVLIRGPPTQPSTPQTTRASNHSLKLKWTPPNFDGNSPLVNYVIESHSGDDMWTVTAECPSNKTSITIKNLSTKLIYRFRVIAANKLGSSQPSSPSPTVTLRPLQRVLALSPNVDLSEDESTPNISYVYSQEIGRGRFAVVYTCGLKAREFNLAAKIERAISNAMKPLQHEASILSGLKHPNIAELIELEHISDIGRLIVELVPGPPLLERIVSEDLLTEAVAVRYLHQVLLAVLYLHQSSVAHNDIRPSNILTTATEPPLVKLVDFGSAFRIENFSQTTVPLATEFTSPEALEELALSGQVDMWALGVICYIILTGISPFFAESHEFSHTAYNILTCNYSLQESVFQDISQEAQDFIQQLLVLDAQVRLTATGCLSHPWIRELTQSAGHSPWPMPQLSKDALKQLTVRLQSDNSLRATKSQFLVQKDGQLTSPLITELAPYVSTSGDVTAELDKNIQLTFCVSGDPTPVLTWEMNSAKLSPEDTACLITYREGQAVIAIDKVATTHQGIYSCTATNRLGSATATASLLIEGAPIAPLCPQAILITQKKALVSWQGSVEKLESVSYSLERLGPPEGKWELLAGDLETTAFVDSSLEGGNKYQYRVYSYSRSGVSCPSLPTPPLLVPGLGASLEEESELAFQQRFSLCGELEVGRSAAIKMCQEIQTGSLFVAKFIPITSRSQEDFKRETDIHKELTHAMVTVYNSRFFTPSNYILVLEHMSKGNLLQHISHDKLNWSESELKHVISQLLQLLSYLSSAGVVHCNLEPESLLVGEGGEVKVTDFSLSRRSGEHVPASSLSLSARGFVAPEVLRGACVTSQSDIWSLGCLCLLLTTGTIFSNSQTGHEPVVREKCQLLSDRMSTQGHKFVEQCLVINPTIRMTAEVASAHPWFSTPSESPQYLLTPEQINNIISERNYL